MTKHDSWVKLKPGNPYEPILHLFPDGMIPMRDPFPMELSKDRKASVWVIDLERLSSVQANALAQIIATHCGADPLEVATEALKKGGFAMNNDCVESMECGPEGFRRSKELADFLETAPRPASRKAWAAFYNSQYQRWIHGNEEPPPINSIEDIDPRLRLPEQERILTMQQINNAMASGNYSIFDVLTGRAFVDVMNQLDPENHWSLVGDDDDKFDDDDIYE